MSRKAYPTYKPSGVEWSGEIPEHWPIVRLRFSAKINPSRSELNGVPEIQQASFIPMEAVHEYGGLSLDQTRPLSEVGTGYTYFREGDVLTAKITPCFENGKGSIAKGLYNGLGFGTTELHVLRPYSDLDRSFLFYVTISDAFRKLGASYMYGAGGQKRVPDDFVKDFRQPMPPPVEQQAIASLLDRETARIDSLIEKKKRQIELLQEKRSALISHAVTKGLDPNVKMKDSGVEWLGEIPEHWEVKSIRRIAKAVKTGGTPAGAEEMHFDQTGFNWYTPSDFHVDVTLSGSSRRLSEIGKKEVRLFPAMTVMMVGIGATIGKVALSLEPSSCNQQINAIVCNSKMTPKFLTYLLRIMRAYIFRCGKFTTLPIINQEDTKALIITCPPLPEQDVIVSILDNETERTDALIGKIQMSIDKLREYRTALISAAVTGKIDVRKEVS